MASPPSPAHTLVGINFSHYVERGRWALDAAGIDYRFAPALPVLHIPLVAGHLLWAGLTPRARGRGGSPFSTPLLITRDARTRAVTAVLQDSGDILRLAHDTTPSLRLLPPDGSPAAAECAALMALCCDELGPAARVAAYHHLLPQRRLMGALGARSGAGWLARAAWAAALPLWIAAVRSGLKVTPRRAERAEATVRDVFAAVGAALAASAAAGGVGVDEAYLLPGAGFSAADLTFAALAAPVLGLGYDEGYAGWVPPVRDVPAGMQALVAGLRDTPAGRHAVRMYAVHRPRRAGGGKL